VNLHQRFILQILSTCAFIRTIFESLAASNYSNPSITIESQKKAPRCPTQSIKRRFKSPIRCKSSHDPWHTKKGNGILREQNSKRNKTNSSHAQLFSYEQHCISTTFSTEQYCSNSIILKTNKSFCLNNISSKRRATFQCIKLLSIIL